MGVWEVCLVVEKCPSPVNLFHLPQRSRTPFSMLKEGSLWSPHVVEARVATLCWQVLTHLGPTAQPLGHCSTPETASRSLACPFPSIHAPLPCYHRPAHKPPAAPTALVYASYPLT